MVMEPSCSNPDCARPRLARGLCSKHYQQLRAIGFPETEPLGCDVANCDRPHKSHRWCQRHYDKWRRTGDPLTPNVHAPTGELPDYFYSHINDDTDECIIWPYSTNGVRGYGLITIAGKQELVHVVACAYRHGPRPDGMEAGHTPIICHTRLCFNPRHLSWVTPKENQAHRWMDGTEMEGDEHTNAKLTRAKVSAIRARYAAGDTTQYELAAEYGISQSIISLIINRKAWTSD